MAVLVLWLGVGLLLVAALHDIVARTIPDGASIAIAGVGLLLRWHDGALLGAGVAFAMIAAGALLCWRLGVVGGGDVKLLAAVALFLPPDLTPVAIVAIAVLGAVLAVPYIALRTRLKRPPVGRRSLPLIVRGWRAERWRLRRGGPLPYGAAIAGGVIVTLWGAA